MANNSVRYPPELRERAVRMVLEATREGVYSSEWAAICAVAQMLGPSRLVVCGPFAKSWDCGLVTFNASVALASARE